MERQRRAEAVEHEIENSRRERTAWGSGTRGGRDGGKVTIYTAHFPQSRSKSFTLRGATGLTWGAAFCLLLFKIQSCHVSVHLQFPAVHTQTARLFRLFYFTPLIWVFYHRNQSHKNKAHNIYQISLLISAATNFLIYSKEPHLSQHKLKSVVWSGLHLLHLCGEHWCSSGESKSGQWSSCDQTKCLWGQEWWPWT